MNKLDVLRKRVDLADEKLLQVLAERFKVVSKIGEYKRAKKIPALDSKRWKIVLNSRIRIGKEYGLPKSLVEKIYEAIHEHSLELEEK